MICATGASTRISAPNERAALAIAVAEAAHPATGNPHDAELAVADVADLVVGHHERGARRARAGPRADDPAHREHTEHLRRLEVVLEQVGDAHREEPGDVRCATDAEAPQPPGQRSLGGEIGRTPAANRAAGPPMSSGPSTAARPSSQASHASIASASRAENLLDLGATPCVVARQLQRATVGVGDEVGALRVHVVAVAVELEVAHE